MQKRLIPFAVGFIAVLLVLFAHFGARFTRTAPAFSFPCASEAREIYLTFDDGPSTRVTGDILDTLRNERVKATFFVVGERIPGREETLRRIAAEGHTIGVHSQTHRYGEIYASNEAFLRDVEACRNAIEKTAQVEPRCYRFPGGGEHAEKRKLLEERGYTIVSWNAVCGDEEIPGASAETLAKTALSTAKDKTCVILLLHDSATHRATAEALPAIISGFREKGYAFKTF